MNDFVFESDIKTGKIASVKLYGEELLDPQSPCSSELLVNGLPLKTEQTDGTRISLRGDGKFPAVPAGIYKMAYETKTA